MATKNLKAKKIRGVFLTICLICHTLGALVFLFTIQQLSANPALFTNFKAIFGLVILILVVCSAVGMWLWKKWSGYLLMVLFVMWLLSFYLYETPHLTINNMLIELAWYLILSGVYFWAIKRKWQYFS